MKKQNKFPSVNDIKITEVYSTNEVDRKCEVNKKFRIIPFFDSFKNTEDFKEKVFRDFGIQGLKHLNHIDFKHLDCVDGTHTVNSFIIMNETDKIISFFSKKKTFNEIKRMLKINMI